MWIIENYNTLLLIGLPGLWIDVSNAATSDDSHTAAVSDESHTATKNDSNMATVSALLKPYKQNLAKTSVSKTECQRQYQMKWCLQK